MSLLQRATSAAADLKNRGNGCLAYDPSAKAPTYGYVPILAPGIVFTIAFALTMAAHTYQFIATRKWWYSAFALGALGELMGWAARIAAHGCPYNDTIFSLQISILIISPCFYSAGCYYILSQLIYQYGRQFSPISPMLYLIIFCTIDVISIAIQGTGGGLASSAGSKTPPGDTGPGTSVMMAGIIIQLVSMCIFCMLWLYFLWKARAVPYSRVLVLATSFSSFCIVVRNFYRTVELSQGWTGYLITHEVYFCVLDGMLMVLAVVVFNIFHPAKYVNGIPEAGHGDLAMKEHETDEEIGGVKSY